MEFGIVISSMYTNQCVIENSSETLVGNAGSKARNRVWVQDVEKRTGLMYVKQHILSGIYDNKWTIQVIYSPQHV